MSSLALITACAAVALAAILRRRLMVMPVTGMSMAPGIDDGDRIVVWRGVGARLRVGTVVLIQGTPAQPWIIKRVVALPGDLVPVPVRAAVRDRLIVPAGKMVVLADNPDGSDSRHWGFMRVDDVRGRVVHTLRRSPAAIPALR